MFLYFIYIIDVYTPEVILLSRYNYTRGNPSYYSTAIYHYK